MSGAARSTPVVDGWVEYFHWSPNGRRILLGVAGHGADVAGGHGAVTSKQVGNDVAAWMPTVETGDEAFRWRRVWVYEIDTEVVRQVSRADTNIWEGVWCGNEALAVIVSPGPSEGLWYSASLDLLDAATGERRELYRPKDQVGWLAGSPSGRHLAMVQALCSDRWIVAGDLCLIDTISGNVQRLNTGEVDITHVEWRSELLLLLAGHRGFETVVGLYDLTTSRYSQLWASSELSIAGRYAAVAGFGDQGDCALIGESFLRSPEIARLAAGQYHTVKSFATKYQDYTKAIAVAEPLIWSAPDGLEIQGWLLKPQQAPPYPLVLFVHGGPVWHWRPAWLARAGAWILLLAKRGYAVLLSNPRGSSGRGQAYARQVLGEMGGAETFDHLAGIDHLVKAGVADPRRLGVTGGSHGGFMTSWLITQDSRFAAAVATAPVTNQVTEHLIGNIPHFISLFLADKFNNPNGKYFTRSPVMYAHQVKTPTLNICGALDRCTPAEEAMQFHNALRENGVQSVLITYPDEGHGVRKFPAAIDYTARLVEWFEEHLRN